MVALQFVLGSTSLHWLWNTLILIADKKKLKLFKCYVEKYLKHNKKCFPLEIYTSLIITYHSNHEVFDILHVKVTSKITFLLLISWTGSDLISWISMYRIFNPLVANAPFLYPVKLDNGEFAANGLLYR